MGRPENPITWDGPAADLALRLRQIRDHAGRPPYQALAAKGHYSPAVLADAAAGRTCPTWDVTKAYAEACGTPAAAIADLHPLWAKADAARRGRAPARKPRPAGPPGHVPRQRQPAPAPAAGEPRPDRAATPAQLARQLRALRAWAGDPGPAEISRRAGRRLPPSTLHDALNPRRATLPPLHVVQAVAAACATPASATAWTTAWRAVRMLEFNRHDPAPVPEQPPAPPPGTGLRLVR